MTLLEETRIDEPQAGSPDLSFAQFQLPPFLQEGLRRAKFERPTMIQAQAIPVLLAGKDLVAQSQTGSGKTAAFALPILSRVQSRSRDLQALVLVPTRELALQVTQVFKLLAGPALRITTIYGGVGMEGQTRGLLHGGYQIVVGTPGRLRDHLNRGTLRLNRLRMLVLDEADEMLDRGFAADVEALIQATPQTGWRQTALFSATMPEWVMDTATKYLRPGYNLITVDPADLTKPDIEHLVYDMTLADKTVALRHLLDNNSTEPVVVFLRTKHGVKKLAARLENEGYSVAGLQGNLSQKAREEVMAAFRARKIRILVATNVGARGLDVSGISHVINFDLPESPELFTHRVGRTGRNGASGTAITFLIRDDMPKWREISQALRTNGIEFTRQDWQGPRARPGEEPAFTQPVQRGSRPAARPSRADFRITSGQVEGGVNRRPPRRDFDQPRRDSRPERASAENSARPPRTPRRPASYR